MSVARQFCVAHLEPRGKEEEKGKKKNSYVRSTVGGGREKRI